MKQPTSWQPVSRIKGRHDVILGYEIMTTLFHQEDQLISRISYSRDEKKKQMSYLFPKQGKGQNTKYRD